MQRHINALVPFIIIGAVFYYLFNRVVTALSTLTGNVLNKTQQFIDGITAQPLVLGFSKEAIIAGLVGVLFAVLIVLYSKFNKKHSRPEEEHGSTVWKSPWQVRKLRDKNPDENIILSQNMKISINYKNNKYDKNKNVMVAGSTRSRKTRSFIWTNLMQLGCSNIITETKGRLLEDTGIMLQQAGYVIKIFDITEFSKSMHYNPLHYVKSETDILRLVEVLILNTTGKNDDLDFWVKAERLIYAALLAYMLSETPIEERNFSTLSRLMDVEEDDLDLLFEDLKKIKPDCFAVRQYKKFKKAKDKALDGILLSCAVRLAPFDIPELEKIMAYDDLELDLIGDRKTAFFVMMSDTESTYNFVLSMLFSQMFSLFAHRVDTIYKGKAPVHVRFLLDEFANIGKLPNFDKIASTISSRNGSISIILQSLAQVNDIYGREKAQSILNNFATYIFLGGTEPGTNKDLADRIGKTTIRGNTIRKSSKSVDSSESIIGRYLIDPAEISRLDPDYCIVNIQGMNPVMDRKANPKKHKRYKEIVEGGGDSFDVLSYLELKKITMGVKEDGVN